MIYCSCKDYCSILDKDISLIVVFRWNYEGYNSWILKPWPWHCHDISWYDESMLMRYQISSTRHKWAIMNNKVGLCNKIMPWPSLVSGLTQNCEISPKQIRVRVQTYNSGVNCFNQQNWALTVYQDIEKIGIYWGISLDLHVYTCNWLVVEPTPLKNMSS